MPELVIGGVAIQPGDLQRLAHLPRSDQQARRRTSDFGSADDKVIAQAIRREPVPSLPIGKRQFAAVAGRKQYFRVAIDYGLNADRWRKLGKIREYISATTQTQNLTNKMFAIDRVQGSGRNLIEHGNLGHTSILLTNFVNRLTKVLSRLDSLCVVTTELANSKQRRRYVVQPTCCDGFHIESCGTQFVNDVRGRAAFPGKQQVGL